ncbi:MAG: M23 family metallopeptidase [Nanoarchaeota archaeon]|nr:M23 family metallopeptidase [Nanoarchaeota archaeon]
MVHPLKNWQKVKRGYKFGVKTFYSSHHLGVDYIVSEGTPIYAPVDCQIIKSGNFSQGGNTIHVTFNDLEHGKLIIRYMHLSKLFPKGDYNEGCILGYTGNTGKYTKGPHLHLDLSKEKVVIKDFKNFIDPDKYFTEMEILGKYKLKKVRNLINRVVLCQNSAGELVVFKRARGDECIMAFLVNELANDYNSKFSSLQLPTYNTIDKKDNIVIMPFYDGKNYIESWNSDGLYGGKYMKLELVKEIVQVIRDFSKIDTNKVIEYLTEHQIVNFQFDFEEWKKQFINNAKFFLENDFISQKEFHKANKLFGNGFKKSKLIFNNGDYYPRNILSYKGKIVVIDWQTWNGNYRANIIDYIENVAAFAFIHMWNNHLWQIEFLKELRKYFKINFKCLRNAILIKSFEQANFWRNNPGSKKQLFIFKNILDDNYIKQLEKDTRPSLINRILRIVKIIS